MNRNTRLIVVAPEALWDSLNAGLASLYPDLELIQRPETPSLSSDPYSLVDFSQTLSPRSVGILLIAPTRRSPARLVPAPVLHHIPVGIVQAESVAQLKPWLRALSATHTMGQGIIWAVLAMWKEDYLLGGERFTHWMQAGVEGKGIDVQKWFADAISRKDVCERLTYGPRLAVYIGHGRARGWSGYRGIRWEHITAIKLREPCGVLMSLACDTLKQARGVIPFGCRWVREGRACSYVGSVDRVNHEANTAFARELGRIIAMQHSRTIGNLLSEVNDRLERDTELAGAKQAFLTYRIMGNPLQPLY